MELTESQKDLLFGLQLVLENKDVILAIALMLKTEDQMEAMMQWIAKHYKEKLDEETVLQAAKAVLELVP